MGKRAWLLIPAMGVAAGTLALAIGDATPIAAVAIGLTGAALAAAIRSVCGESPAALVGAAIAALLGCVGTLGFDSTALLRASLASTAAVWTIAELTTAVAFIELAAIASAVIATVLDPSFAPLIAITGARLVTGHPRRRWAVAVIAAGALIVALAVFAALATDGALAALWRAWSGAHASAHAIGVAAVVDFGDRIGDALGPIAAVAALGGIVVVAGRGRWAALAIVPVVVGAWLVGARGGMVGGSVVVVASLAAGVAIARLAGLVRLPIGQLAVGATAGLMLLLPPTWIAVERDAPARAGKVVAWTSSAVTRTPRRGPARRSRSATSTACTSVIAR